MRSPLKILALPLLLATTLVGCVELVDESRPGADPPNDDAAAGPRMHNIAMHDEAYFPARIAAAKGDTLRFAAHDTTHSVGTTNGVYDAGDVPTGTSKEVWLNLAGDYTFQCRFHGDMRLAVTVTP